MGRTRLKTSQFGDDKFTFVLFLQNARRLSQRQLLDQPNQLDHENRQRRFLIWGLILRSLASTTFGCFQFVF